MFTICRPSDGSGCCTCRLVSAGPNSSGTWAKRKFTTSRRPCKEGKEGGRRGQLVRGDQNIVQIGYSKIAKAQSLFEKTSLHGDVTNNVSQLRSNLFACEVHGRVAPVVDLRDRSTEIYELHHRSQVAVGRGHHERRDARLIGRVDAPSCKAKVTKRARHEKELKVCSSQD